jgi:flagellar basal-body rod modification protein FlgD
MDIQAINRLSNTDNTLAGATSAKLGNAELSTNTFLKLLTVQLQHQDPLSPMDPQNMLTQLAQFSSLEQSQQLNKQLAASRQETALSQAVSLTGQNLNLRLQNGTQVQGVVQEVVWNNGAMALQINGARYAMTDIASITPTEPTPTTP